MSEQDLRANFRGHITKQAAESPAPKKKVQKKAGGEQSSHSPEAIAAKSQHTAAVPSFAKSEQQPSEREALLHPPNHRLEYRAVGAVRSRFVPEADRADGTILGAIAVAAEDSGIGKPVAIAAVLSRGAAAKAAAAVAAGEPQVWSVYPRTEREEPPSKELYLEIKGIRASELPASSIFSVRGEVVFCDATESKVVVLIRQNRGKRWKRALFEPFRLLLRGTLPEPAIATFWSFEVELHGTELAIVRADRVAPAKSG